jgi:hypothetical protein
MYLPRLCNQLSSRGAVDTSTDATCVDVIEFDDKTGRVKRIRVDHLGALDKLARHLNLLRPEVTPAPSGPVAVNFTDIYLDGLTVEELLVLKRLLARKRQIDAQYGVTPPSGDVHAPQLTGETPA